MWLHSDLDRHLTHLPTDIRREVAVPSQLQHNSLTFQRHFFFHQKKKVFTFLT